MAKFGRKLFPSFSEKYERRFQRQTAPARQDYTDLVTRCLLGTFLIWLVIDLARVHEYHDGPNSNLANTGRTMMIWVSHAVSCALTIAFLGFTRSKWFLRPSAEYSVPVFIFLIAAAITVRRYLLKHKIIIE